jgi:hypothetical protein
MKNRFLQIIALALVSAFFTSCSKCVDCADCPEEVTLDQTEICQDDFDSKDEYNSAVAVIEAFGCDCK